MSLMATFCVRSAEHANSLKGPFIISAEAHTDMAVGVIKKYFAAKELQCSEDECLIVGNGDTISPEEIAQEDASLLKKLVEVYKKKLAGISDVNYIISATELPRGKKVHYEAVIRILENGKVLRQKNEIVRTGEEFAVLRNKFE